MESAAQVSKLFSNTSVSPTASELSIEEKTTNALQGLASYFSAQFILTNTSDTWTGWGRSFIFTQPKYQGLSAVMDGFKSAVKNFNLARSALTAVQISKFDENAKQLLSETLNKLKTVAPGTRFHEAMNTWLAIFDQASLDDTKRFIAQCQKIFENRSITIEIGGTDTVASALPIASISYPDKSNVMFIEFSNAATSTTFVREDTYTSVFDAMQAVAAKHPQERPKGTQTSLDSEFLMAQLLSTSARKPNPSEQEAIQTMYRMLTLYPKMHAALSEAAKNSGASNVDSENFPLHCAIMQTLLLTIAEHIESDEQKTLERMRKDNNEKHWASHTKPEMTKLIQELTSKLNRQRTKTTDTISFSQASAEIKDLIATLVSLDGKTSSVAKYSKEQFLNTIKYFLKGDQDSAEALIKLFIQYIEALGAVLTQSINSYRNTNEVKNAFDANLALELIKTMRIYVLSPEFKEGLGIKKAATDDEMELLDEHVVEQHGSTTSAATESGSASRVESQEQQLTTENKDAEVPASSGDNAQRNQPILVQPGSATSTAAESESASRVESQEQQLKTENKDAEVPAFSDDNAQRNQSVVDEPGSATSTPAESRSASPVQIDKPEPATQHLESVVEKQAETSTPSSSSSSSPVSKSDQLVEEYTGTHSRKAIGKTTLFSNSIPTKAIINSNQSGSAQPAQAANQSAKKKEAVSDELGLKLIAGVGLVAIILLAAYTRHDAQTARSIHGMRRN